MGAPALEITDAGRECSRCWKWHPWSEYPIDRHMKTGHKATCRTCTSAMVRGTYKRKNSGGMFRRMFQVLEPGIQRGHWLPGTAVEGMLEDGFFEPGSVLEERGVRFRVVGPMYGLQELEET